MILNVSQVDTWLNCTPYIDYIEHAEQSLILYLRLVINYGEAGNYKMGKSQVQNLLHPPSRQGKAFCAPPSYRLGTFCAPSSMTIWLKLQATA